MTTALEAAREAAAAIDPAQAARNCGFGYEGSGDRGRFSAVFLGREIRLDFPSFEGTFAGASGPAGAWRPNTSATDEVPDDVCALLAYHLAESDGTKPSGEWISFTDLPDGSLYCSTWRGYTGQVLAARFGNNLRAVRKAAEALGSRPTRVAGDVALAFSVLPRVPVALQYWAGDDEFEPRADFLFDSTAGHHLSTDSYAVLCKWLTDMLVGQADTSMR